MANMQSILESDTKNINQSGSNIKPYPLNSTDIAKQSKPDIKTQQQEEPMVQDAISMTVPIEKNQTAEQNQQDVYDEQLNQEASLAQAEFEINRPELTWDTATEEQKMFFKEEKGGLTYYDYYFPQLNKVARINSSDPKVIARRVALSQAKNQDEINNIWFASYYDDKNTVYMPFPYKQYAALSFAKGATNSISEWVEGANRFLVDNARYTASKSMENLFNELTDISKSPEYATMLLQTPKALSMIAGMTPEEKQVFFSAALDRYTKSLEDQSKSFTKTSPSIERYKAELMKNIPDPVQYLQGLEEGIDYSDERLKKFLDNEDVKKYLNPKQLGESEAIRTAFQNNPFIAEKMEGIKIGSKKIAEAYNNIREFIGVNYDPRFDSETAYKLGGLSASYAASLMSIMTGSVAPAAILFAGASYKETMDKAIEKGFPIDKSLQAAYLNAAKEAITEQIQLRFFRAKFTKIDEMISKEMFNLVFENAVQEGTQDFLQKGIEQLYGIDQFTMEDYVTDFIINAGVGAIMSAPMGAVVQYNKVKYIKSLMKTYPNMAEKDAINLTDKIINMGTKIMSSKEGSESFISTLNGMLKINVSTDLKSKTQKNYDTKELDNIINNTYKYLTSGMTKEEQDVFAKDFRDTTKFTQKYLTETVGMFDSEAKLLSPMFNQLFSSLSKLQGVSMRQVAEDFLPNVVNLSAIHGLNNYSSYAETDDLIKFEAAIQKTLRNQKGLGGKYLTEENYLDIAKMYIKGFKEGKDYDAVEKEITDKYKLPYSPNQTNAIRQSILLHRIDIGKLYNMLKNNSLKQDIANSDTKNYYSSTMRDINALLKMQDVKGSPEYNLALNKLLRSMTRLFGTSLKGSTIFGLDKKSSNGILFLNPDTGTDIHEISHFLQVVYALNQRAYNLGMPVPKYFTDLMDAYNELGKAITKNPNFVFDFFSKDKEQLKVSEAFSQLMSEYLINGNQNVKYRKIFDEINSLYKYINSTFAYSDFSEGYRPKEGLTEEEKKEVDKAAKNIIKTSTMQKKDVLLEAMVKLNELLNQGDFSNKDIYNIVKDLKLNNALKLSTFIENNQNPVITILEAMYGIQNTRLDSMYRKAIDFNSDIIPAKYMTIPEGALFEGDFEYGIIQQAKKEWEASDKSLQASRDIYKKYGVYQDEQGSWGYIISDKDMSINEETFKYIKDNLGKLNEFDSKLKLGEFIKHDQLFNIDSSLKNIRLKISYDMPSSNLAAVDLSGTRPVILLNNKLFDKVEIYELKKSLVHEIQHIIDKGANLNLAGNMYGEIEKLIKNDSRFKDFLDYYNKGTNLQQKNKAGTLSEEEKSLFKDILDISEKAYNLYRAEIGEVRAFQSQEDMDKTIEELFNELSPVERRTVTPIIKNEYASVVNLSKKEAFDKVMKDYDRHLQENEQDEAFELNMTVSEIMSNNFSKAAAVVSEVLKKDSPKLFAHSRSAMFKAMQYVKYYKYQASELAKSIRKMSNDDLYNWEKAWNNRDIETMYKLAEKYDFAVDLAGVQKSLRELHQIVSSSFEGEQYNQLLGFLQDYFPRLVINHDGLASALSQRHEKFDASNDVSETNNNKMDKWFDEVAQWLEGDLLYSKKKQGSPYFYKQRQVEFVDDELMPFYAKSTDALDNYINKVQDILFRKYFFGSEYVKAIMNADPKGKQINMNGIDYVIPNWKQRIKEMGFLTGDAKTDKRILDAIESVFFRGDTSSWNAIYRTATNIMTINSFFSALSNLGDLALTLYNYGLKNTMSAVKDVAVKEAPVTIDDLGITDLYEEFKADGTKLKKIFNWTMKWSGFKYLDTFTKEVNIQAALLSAKENLQKGGDAEAKLIDKCYMYMGGDEEAANALISNIINNNWTDPDVKLFAFNELSNQQPITKLEVPEFYNRYPQFRALYLYKTFAVKQLNFAYANIIDSIKKNPKDGFKKLIRFMAWLMAVGVTKDIIADMLKGKEIHLTDSAMFSITSFFFLNEYNYYTFKSKGAAIGVFHLVMPPVPLMAEISSDVKKMSKGRIKNPMGLQVIKGVPVIGKPFYYWFSK